MVSGAEERFVQWWETVTSAARDMSMLNQRGMFLQGHSTQCLPLDWSRTGDLTAANRTRPS